MVSKNLHSTTHEWSAPRSVDDVGRFVTRVRRRTGLTQAQLAERAGVGRRFVNELETGHSTLFVERLAAVLAELDIRVVLEAGSDDDGAPSTHRPSSSRDGALPRVKDLGW